eukprot:TRINITY_DN107777_c0_g5_i1.p1 TRINITY_DN107777_c0_g5~~TRINITY_DN107777_c0_g5_i1.p1  ORF type:complete len:889 (+),score=394.08 TRINITY_DN107777_c0_g5_i1:140-2668(+)
MNNNSQHGEKNLTPLFNVPKVEDLDSVKAMGASAVAEGKVAQILLAGGQGTRLGFDKPKGEYNIGMPSELSLFAYQIKKLLKVSGGKAPLLIMTSPMTHNATVDCFIANGYFGYPQDKVHFFEQGTLPCFTEEGEVIIAPNKDIQMAPNGNGGIYEALHEQGMIDMMKENGVEYVQVNAIDNALSVMADSVFVGYCMDKEAKIGVKVMPKANAEEKIGVLCEVDGAFEVVEYSDIKTEDAQAIDESGELKYRHGSICIHLYSLDFLEHECHPDNLSKVLHIARKKIDGVNPKTGEIEILDGIKMESFIFDVFPMAGDKLVAMEVQREHEFAPVKNAPGSATDSPDTARELMSNLHRQWLALAGGVLESEGLYEVSPSVSVDGTGLEFMAGIMMPANKCLVTENEGDVRNPFLLSLPIPPTSELELPIIPDVTATTTDDVVAEEVVEEEPIKEEIKEEVVEQEEEEEEVVEEAPVVVEEVKEEPVEEEQEEEFEEAEEEIIEEEVVVVEEEIKEEEEEIVVEDVTPIEEEEKLEIKKEEIVVEEVEFEGVTPSIVEKAPIDVEEKESCKSCKCCTALCKLCPVKMIDDKVSNWFTAQWENRCSVGIMMITYFMCVFALKMGVSLISAVLCTGLFTTIVLGIMKVAKRFNLSKVNITIGELPLPSRESVYGVVDGLFDMTEMALNKWYSMCSWESWKVTVKCLIPLFLIAFITAVMGDVCVIHCIVFSLVGAPFIIHNRERLMSYVKCVVAKIRATSACQKFEAKSCELSQKLCEKCRPIVEKMNKAFIAVIKQIVRLHEAMKNVKFVGPQYAKAFALCKKCKFCGCMSAKIASLTEEEEKKDM